MMTQGRQKKPTETKDTAPDEGSIDSPRLTPQGRADPDGGEDSTNPMGEGAKQGQSDKAEG
jgi:hypothetical protein